MDTTNAALGTLATGRESAGRALESEGQGARQLGTGWMGQAAGYYMPLVSGARGGMSAALAPERGQITDIYRGARKGLDRSGMVGPGRDVAEAELARDQAGKLAGLAPAARAGAAAALAGMGGQQVGAGLQLSGLGGQAAGQALGARQAQGNNTLGAAGLLQHRADQERGRAADTGMAAGGFLFDALQAQRGKKSGGGANLSPGMAGYGVLK